MLLDKVAEGQKICKGNVDLLKEAKAYMKVVFLCITYVEFDGKYDKRI